MNKFSSKFYKYFLMVSFLSSNIVFKNALYVDSGLSTHMASGWELFSSLREHISRVQVEIGDDDK